MSTKAKTKTESKAKDSEDKFIKAAKAIADAVALVARREADRAKAREYDEELRARAGRDESVTALQLVTSAAEVDLAAARYEEAKRIHAHLVRTRPVSLTLAEAIRSPIAEVLGVPVLISDSMPSSPPEGHALPVAVIVQGRHATEDHEGGYISGQAVIAYFRTKLHADLDSSKIERGLEERGVRLSVGSSCTTSLDERTEVQEVDLEIRAVFPELPIIRDNTTGWVSLVGDALGHRLAEGSFVNGRQTIGARATSRVRDSKTAEGVQRTTVLVELTAWPVRGFWTLGEVGETIRKVAEGTYAGCAFSGMGRVESYKIEHLAPAPDSPSSLGADITVTFVSKRPE